MSYFNAKSLMLTSRSLLLYTSRTGTSARCLMLPTLPTMAKLLPSLATRLMTSSLSPLKAELPSASASPVMVKETGATNVDNNLTKLSANLKTPNGVPVVAAPPQTPIDL